MGYDWRLPFCGVTEKCVKHSLKNCQICIPRNEKTTKEMRCVRDGMTIHLSSYQGVIGKLINKLPDVVWDWDSSECDNCDKDLRTWETNTGS